MTLLSVNQITFLSVNQITYIFRANDKRLKSRYYRTYIFMIYSNRNLSLNIWTYLQNLLQIYYIDTVFH